MEEVEKDTRKRFKSKEIDDSGFLVYFLVALSFPFFPQNWRSYVTFCLLLVNESLDNTILEWHQSLWQVMVPTVSPLAFLFRLYQKIILSVQMSDGPYLSCAHREISLDEPSIFVLRLSVDVGRSAVAFFVFQDTRDEDRKLVLDAASALPLLVSTACLIERNGYESRYILSYYTPTENISERSMVYCTVDLATTSQLMQSSYCCPIFCTSKPWGNWKYCISGSLQYWSY